MSKIFLDTNILAYTMDNDQPAKRDRCMKAIAGVQEEASVVVSTQVLQELYVVGTRKMRLDGRVVKSYVHALRNFEVVSITPELVEEAIDCSILSQLSLWDALIIVAAESAKCDRLWTEDLSKGQVIQGVRVENPLT
jgi:predicted nucleic acid-binding protein